MIINLTPHSIVVWPAEGQELTYPPSGTVARIASTAEVIGQADGVDVVATHWGAVAGLPEPEAGTLYLVSMLVAQALPGRFDLIGPDTGPESAVRAGAGKIVAVGRFQSFAGKLPEPESEPLFDFVPGAKCLFCGGEIIKPRNGDWEQCYRCGAI